MNTRKLRIGFGAALTGAVIGGGLLLGPGLVGAQTPSPTPQQQQQQTPGTPSTPPSDQQHQMPQGGQMPDRNGDGTHDKADCPNMDGGGQGMTPHQGSGSGTSFRGARGPMNQS